LSLPDEDGRNWIAARRMIGSVHRLVRELVTTAPPTVRRDAEDFALHLGVSR
jgi:hypothetical protein